MNQTFLPVIQLQVRYHSWAIREMWRGVSALPTTELTLPKGTSFDTLQATLTHMYTADRVWMNRPERSWKCSDGGNRAALVGFA